MLSSACRCPPMEQMQVALQHPSGTPMHGGPGAQPTLADLSGNSLVHPGRQAGRRCSVHRSSLPLTISVATLTLLLYMVHRMSRRHSP